MDEHLEVSRGRESDMENISEGRDGSNGVPDVEVVQSEHDAEPVTTEADQGLTDGCEEDANPCEAEHGDRDQVEKNDGLDEVRYTAIAEDEAKVLNNEAMDADQADAEGQEGVEPDYHERELDEIEKESIAEEPVADSVAEDEDAGEENADSRSPSGENTGERGREKKRTKSSEDETPSGLPVTRVKRIIKLDPDIRLVSKEGIFAVIHTTQQFLEALAAESVSQAWRSKRKGVKADDILVAARNPRFRDCLGTTLSDFVQHLRGEDSDSEGGGSEDESEREDMAAVSKKSSKKEAKRKCLQPPPGNRSITDFLKAAG